MRGKAGFVLANGGFALPFKDRIEQSELPGRRGLLGENAITATIEMQVFRFVTDLGERCKSGTGVEIHVA